MKTTIKTLALSIMVLMSTVAVAGGKKDKEGKEGKERKEISPELNVQITKMAEAKVAIEFNKLAGEVVKVKIYDANGTLVFADKKSEGIVYAKGFDLSALPSGNFTYNVSNDLYSVTKVLAKN